MFRDVPECSMFRVLLTPKFDNIITTSKFTFGRGVFRWNDLWFSFLLLDITCYLKLNTWHNVSSGKFANWCYVQNRKKQNETSISTSDQFTIIQFYIRWIYICVVSKTLSIHEPYLRCV